MTRRVQRESDIAIVFERLFRRFFSVCLWLGIFCSFCPIKNCLVNAQVRISRLLYIFFFQIVAVVASFYTDERVLNVKFNYRASSSAEIPFLMVGAACFAVFFSRPSRYPQNESERWREK